MTCAGLQLECLYINAWYTELTKRDLRARSEEAFWLDGDSWQWVGACSDSLLQLLVAYKHRYVPDGHTHEGCHEPLVEGSRSLLPGHDHGTVDDSAVRAGRGIHEPRLHHVYGRRHQCGAEACTDPGQEVTGHVVLEHAALQQEVFDDVVGH